MPYSSVTGDRAGEIGRRERLEIVDAFADADEMHRQAEFPGDRDEDAAARRAVELGHHQPGDAGSLAEDFDLIKGVLSSRGVERQQGRVRRASGRPS